MKMMDYRVFDAEQKALGTSGLEAAARWWDHLADCELESAKGYPFGNTDTFHNRSNTYRRTAESLRIQERTGIAVCSCCHKPVGSGLCEYSRRRY